MKTNVYAIQRIFISIDFYPFYSVNQFSIIRHSLYHYIVSCTPISCIKRESASSVRIGLQLRIPVNSRTKVWDEIIIVFSRRFFLIFR